MADMEIVLPSTDADDEMNGGDGENFYDGGAGNDSINGADGVNTIHYELGDGVDRISFALPRSYQYADFLTAAESALTELASLDPAGEYTNFFFATADPGLVNSLPAEIASILGAMQQHFEPGVGMVPSPVEVQAAQAALSQMVAWASQLNRNVVDLGPGISLDDLTVQIGRTTNYGGQDVPLEFAIALNSEEGLVFNLGGSEAIAGDTSVPPVIDMEFRFSDGTTMTLAELLALPGQISMGDQSGGEDGDFLHGSLGNDNLFGNGGDDRIDGAAGDDQLYGGYGNDAMAGGSGFDVMYGDEGDDVLAAGRAGGMVMGGQGNDVYAFNRGDGYQWIENQDWDGSGIDTISFGKDVAPADVSMSLDPMTGTVSLRITGGDDQIDIGWFDPYNENGLTVRVDQAIDRVQFFDAEGNVHVYDLASLVGAAFPDPAAADPAASVALVGESSSEIDEPAAGGEAARRYAMTGTLFETSNQAPVAAHVDDQTAVEDTAFTWALPNGTFVDPEQGTLALKATAADGQALPSWLQFDADTGTFSGIPSNFDVGELTVKVTATDVGGAATSQTFTLNVQNTNDDPTVFQPMADQPATEDAPFRFVVPAATFADVDLGDSMTLSATMSDGAALPAWLQFDPATGIFSGIPENDDVGTLSVRVTAQDAAGMSASDVFDLTVANTNDAPTMANAMADQDASEDAEFTFVVPAATFADVDLGDSMTLSATMSNGGALPDWLHFDADTGTFSGTPANGDVGTISVRVTAKDVAGATATDEFELNVANTNDAPIVAKAIGEQDATEDAHFSFLVPAGTFADVDQGDSMTLSASMSDGNDLPSWLHFDADTRTFSGQPENGHVGTTSVRVTATDEAGVGASEVFDLNVINTNDAPTLASEIADQEAAEDSPFSFSLPAGVFADVDLGDSMTLSVTMSDGSPLPDWLSFDADSMTFSGTPGNAAVGTLHVRVTATDGAGTTASDMFDLNVTNTNDAPTAAMPIADQGATEDMPFSFVVPAATFADVDLGDTMSLSATMSDGSALPSWLNFDAQTRTFSGTPGNGGVGTISVRVTAKDAAGALASDVFDLSVANTNDAPTVAQPIADQSATEDAMFTFSLPANVFADVDLNASKTLSATLANGAALPSWLTFNAASGTFSGRPANGDVGALNIRVTARDAAGATAWDDFSLTVANTNDAPTVANAIADQSASAGSPFSMVVPGNVFQDVDAGDALTLSARLSNGAALPSWLNFDAATRTFSGTAGAAGQWNVEVVATDMSGASVSDVFALNMSAPQPTTPQPVPGKTINGGSGNDKLTGTAGNDKITGGKGKDQLMGGAGDDSLFFSEDGKWGSDKTRSNAFTGEKVSISGKRQSTDIFDGGSGLDILIGTSGADAILLDDSKSSAAKSGPRIVGVEKIDAGGGDDVVDMTSKRYTYGNIEIDGGSGNDTLWSGAGKDVLHGGSGNDTLDGGAGNDYLDGGSGNDKLNGGSGIDLLQGGSGNDTLKDTSGNGLFDGGSGDDSITEGSANSIVIGGKGNDKITLGGGYDVIAFNRGDGKDVVSNGGKGGTATLSLGGGINYKDLTLSRSGNDLILNIGSSDRITFEKWYSDRKYQAVSKLQVVAETMAGFDQGGDALHNDKLETFDFKGLVKAFDSARGRHPGLSKWTLTNALAQFHLGGSDTAALGGDLAHQYGVNGTLAGIAVNAAHDTTQSSQFGKQAQTLHSQAQLKDGLVKLS